MPDEHSIDVPLSWVGYDEVPITFANQFLVQFEPDESFILGVGQATAPAIIGTPEQVAAQARQIEFVPVRPVARIAMTEPKLRELIAALEANLRNFEAAKERRDPRTP